MKMSHVVQSKFEEIICGKFTLQRWITVGTQRERAFTSPCLMIADISSAWTETDIQQTIGIDQVVTSELNKYRCYSSTREWDDLDEVRMTEKGLTLSLTLIGTSIGSQVSSRRLNWMAVHPFSSRPPNANQFAVVLSRIGMTCPVAYRSFEWSKSLSIPSSINDWLRFSPEQRLERQNWPNQLQYQHRPFPHLIGKRW